MSRDDQNQQSRHGLSDPTQATTHTMLKLKPVIMILFFATVVVTAFQNCGQFASIKTKKVDGQATAPNSVIEQDEAPLVLTTAADNEKFVGDDLSLQIEFSRPDDVTQIEWLFNGEVIAGETSLIFSLENLNIDHSGTYSVRITLTDGTTETHTISEVMVSPLASNAPPTPDEVSEGDGEPGATEGEADPGAAEGEESPAEEMPIEETPTDGTPDTANESETTSEPAPLEIEILEHPQSLEFNLGDHAILSVRVTPIPNLTYQWFLNGVAVANQNAQDLIIASATNEDAGKYHVVVTNGELTAQSEDAIITIAEVFTLAPIFTSDAWPSVLAVKVGTSFELDATATGSPMPAYVWEKNGNVINGQSLPSLTFANIQSSDSGDYTVKVSNSSATITQVIKLQVCDNIENNSCANERIVSCPALPAGALFSGKGTITQTWQNGSWAPTAVLRYNPTSEANKCNYKCANTHYWNGVVCKAIPNSGGSVIRSIRPSSDYVFLGTMGDINRDGHDDYAFHDKSFKQNGINYGKLLIYSGRNHSLLWSRLGFLQKDNMRDSFPTMSALGDVNKDGYDDFAVSCGVCNYKGIIAEMQKHAGDAYVYSGRTGGILKRYVGAYSTSVSNPVYKPRIFGIGDYDGDGYSDFNLLGNYDLEFCGSRNPVGINKIISGRTFGTLRTISTYNYSIKVACGNSTVTKTIRSSYLYGGAFDYASSGKASPVYWNDDYEYNAVKKTSRGTAIVYFNSSSKRVIGNAIGSRISGSDGVFSVKSPPAFLLMGLTARVDSNSNNKAEWLIRSFLSPRANQLFERGSDTYVKNWSEKVARYIGDYNGDGLSDYQLIGESAVRSGKNNFVLYSDSIPFGATVYAIGDVNGDGRADLGIQKDDQFQIITILPRDAE